MTSVVKVTAHVSDDKEVVVKVINFETQEVKEEQVLQDGESTEKHIYDSLVVSAVERRKADAAAPAVWGGRTQERKQQEGDAPADDAKGDDQQDQGADPDQADDQAGEKQE